MKSIITGFLLFSIAFVLGCQQPVTKKKAASISATPHAPTAAEIAKSKRDDSAEYYAAHHPSPFQAFLEQQIDTRNMIPDDDWKKSLGEDSETYIIYQDPDSDTPTDCKFPFTDINMVYTTVHYGIENDPEHSCEDGVQFIINGQKLPLDKECGRCDPLITPQTIRRYIYHGHRIITMWGGLKQFNGYGDRIQFNYFFDITAKPPAQDIYTNSDGHVYHPNLYGDLNNDTLLDRLVYDGFEYPAENDTNYVTIKAETYKNKRWQPLKDKNNRPYFIKVATEAFMDSSRVVTSHWMKPLK